MSEFAIVLERDGNGREILWKCSDCGQSFNLGWGSRCNKCIHDKKRHQEILEAIRSAKPVEAATPVSEKEIWAEWSDGNGGTFRAGRVKPEAAREDEGK